MSREALNGWRDQVREFVLRREGRCAPAEGEGLFTKFLKHLFSGPHTPHPDAWRGRGVLRCARCGAPSTVMGFDAYIPSCDSCRDEVEEAERGAATR